MDWIILILAAFAGGVLNAIAGGGSFLTLPALVYAGLPPVSANATSALAVFPGYLGAAVGFRKQLGQLEKRLLYTYLGIATLGGWTGSLLLLISSNTFFRQLIPWLILFATIIFAVGRKLTAWLLAQKITVKQFEYPLLFTVSVYGGYFNGGLGIILLAAFISFGFESMAVMNGLKNSISLVLSIVSVATFIVAGLIAWPQALTMMVAATCGGYIGARWAITIPDHILHQMIVCIGLVMTVLFFLS